MVITYNRLSRHMATNSLIFLISGFLNVGAPAVASAQSGAREQQASEDARPASSSQGAASDSVASSFAELAGLVKPGAVIRVTEVSGRTTKGRLGQLSPSSLELLRPKSGRDGRDVPIRPLVFSEADVQSIELEHRDSLANGALMGLAVGGLGGLVGGAAYCGDYSCQAGPVAAAFGALFGGIGAGVGALTDLAISGHTSLYQAPRQRSAVIRVSPVMSNSAVGALVSVRF